MPALSAHGREYTPAPVTSLLELATRRWLLVAAMAAAVAIAVAGVVWALERESAEEVDRLGPYAQAMVRLVAHDLGPTGAVDRALAERVGAGLAYQFYQAGPEGLRDVDGRPVHSPVLERLVAGREERVALDREAAEALGLPGRRAVAVRAALGDGRLLVAVRSFASERLQARREQTVVVAGLVAVALATVGLGGVALRREQQRLALTHVVETAALARERDEQLARADRIAVASALSLGVAHELATPLSVISAKVEQLEKVAGDDRSRQAGATIGNQVEQMRRIVRGFLALARGEQPELAPTPPSTVATQAAAAVRHRFAEAGVRLELEVEPELPAVAVDAPLFQQALVNLLVNAAQASPAGGLVEVGVRREGGGVCFEVADRGAGLQPQALEQATKPFVTTRATSGGTGLGLAITAEIVRHHGGALELRPRPGGGLLARLTLPRRSERGA